MIQVLFRGYLFILATIGISQLAAPCPSQAHTLRHCYHPRSDRHLTYPLPSILANQAFGINRFGRGELEPCASPHGDLLRYGQLMSQNPSTAIPGYTLRAEHLNTAALQNQKLTHEPSGVGSSPVEQRPASTQPPGPVGSPLEPVQVRSIGVHSILNSPVSATNDLTGNPVRNDGPGLKLAGLPSLTQQLPPAAPATYHDRRVSLSPNIGKRMILPPASPSARLARRMARNSSYSGPSTSPYPPLCHESAGRFDSPSIGSHPPVPSVHYSMPPLLGPRDNVALVNPVSHKRSSSTLHAPSRQVQCPSPAVPIISASLPTGSMCDPLVQLASAAGSQRYVGSDQQQVAPFLQGKIPLFFDMKSGSSSQAAKRKANSDASRRFRHRKRNGEEMEKRIVAQQDEIQKQAERLQQQAKEIQALVIERDHYRTERDFYRKQVQYSLPPAQVQARPPSPQLACMTSEENVGQIWHETGAKPPLPSTVSDPTEQLANNQSLSVGQSILGSPYTERSEHEVTPSSQSPRTWLA